MTNREQNNRLSQLDISYVKTLQNALTDLLDGKYNEGDNNTGLTDKRFMELVDMKDRIFNITN
jgi:hypothetical protein